MVQQAQGDLCVVGSGVAGLMAALAAAERGTRVLLTTAGLPLSGSSLWAQGGIAAAVGAGDRTAYHEADTLAVGAGLNDKAAVHVLVNDGKRQMNRLLREGVPFDGGPITPDLGLEAGHGARRILHAGGGATGEHVSTALLAQVRRHRLITLLADTPVDRLLLDGGRVVGVGSGARTYTGRAVVLTTGGYAGWWGRTTNPLSNRGSGLGLAWSAGATLADLEFVQFHPTAFVGPRGETFLLTEALRGEGALLVDADEQPVVDPLLPRDIVARALAHHLREQGPVYLSLRHLDPDFVAHRFPNIVTRLQAWGMDLARDLLPVAPAAHYCMGGVRTDLVGRTDVPGLYVAGEAACTGAQGANRLASNSLLECVVFGRRAATAALQDSKTHQAHWHTTPLPVAPVLPPAAAYPCLDPLEWGARLDRDLGVERDAVRLTRLITDLPEPGTCAAVPEQPVVTLAAQAALLRAESRGAHYRADAPTTRPEWQGRILWRRGQEPQFEEVVA